MVGAFLDPADRLGSVETMMIAIIAIVALKNVFVWLAGQLGASLQENVTRDLRDGVFRHLQRLPLGYFQRTKTGQIISRVLVRHRADEGADHRAGDAHAAERWRRSSARSSILLSYSVRLTFVALVIAPLLTLALQPVLRKLRKGHRRLRGDYGEITSVLQEVGERRAAREVVPRRAVRGRALHRGEPPLLVGHGAHHAHRVAVAADDGADRRRRSRC